MTPPPNVVSNNLTKDHKTPSIFSLSEYTAFNTSLMPTPGTKFYTVYKLSLIFIQDIEEAVVFQEPNLFCHFASGIGEPKYLPVPNIPDINKILVEALDGYNEINAVMNLVLFEDAIFHILKINRILEMPRGNALLVGVGGSGKQSLSRLSSYISGLDVFQITLRKGYSIPDLKLDLGQLCIKAGVKNVGVVFLMTDSQVFFFFSHLI